MDLSQYRASDSELMRTADLMRLTPAEGTLALDVGARDGFFSLLLAERFRKVIALDLEAPVIHHPRVECAQGDITDLHFADNSFDFVFCAEVLEHIPPANLERACSELVRVSSGTLVIGVPYLQDTRVGRTTCRACWRPNPPWGHVNQFTQERLESLFPRTVTCEISLVGRNAEATNVISTLLMDFAGNPYGTYEQEESCIHCGHQLTRPVDERSALQRLATRIAFLLNDLQRPLTRAHGNWIHLLLRKGT